MAGADAMRERIALTPGPAGVSRSSERTAAIRSQPAHRRRGRALAAYRQGGQRAGPVAAARDLGHAGNFGPLLHTLPLDEALDFVATEGFFWIKRLTLKASRNVQTRTSL